MLLKMNNKNFNHHITEAGFWDKFNPFAKKKPLPDLNSFINAFKREALLLDADDLQKLQPSEKQLNGLITKWYNAYVEAYNNDHGEILADTLLGILRIANQVREVPITPTELFEKYYDKSRTSNTGLINLNDQQLQKNLHLQKGIAALESLAAADVEKIKTAAGAKPNRLNSKIPDEEIENIMDVARSVASRLQRVNGNAWTAKVSENVNLLKLMLVMMERTPGQVNIEVLKHAKKLVKNLGIPPQKFVDILERERLQVGDLEQELERVLTPAQAAPAYQQPALDPAVISKENLKNYSDWVVNSGLAADFKASGDVKKINRLASLVYMLHNSPKEKDAITDYFDDVLDDNGGDTNVVLAGLRRHNINTVPLKAILASNASGPANGQSTATVGGGQAPIQKTPLILAYESWFKSHPNAKLKLKNPRNIQLFLGSRIGQPWVLHPNVNAELNNYISSLP